MPNRPALGLIETRGLIGAIEAADAAAKAAQVTITAVEVTVPALVTVKMEGELGAVQASVNAGAAAASRVGELVCAHVIPRPDDELDKILPDRRYTNPASLQPEPPRSGPKLQFPSDDAALEQMTVVDLRRLAREQSGFPLSGREISHANKEELLRRLREFRDRQKPGA
jgi:ethanolamine utilization protein EutM